MINHDKSIAGDFNPPNGLYGGATMSSCKEYETSGGCDQISVDSMYTPNIMKARSILCTLFQDISTHSTNHGRSMPLVLWSKANKGHTPQRSILMWKRAELRVAATLCWSIIRLCWSLDSESYQNSHKKNQVVYSPRMMIQQEVTAHILNSLQEQQACPSSWASWLVESRHMVRSVPSGSSQRLLLGSLGWRPGTWSAAETPLAENWHVAICYCYVTPMPHRTRNSCLACSLFSRALFFAAAFFFTFSSVALEVYDFTSGRQHVIPLGFGQIMTMTMAVEVSGLLKVIPRTSCRASASVWPFHFVSFSSTAAAAWAFLENLRMVANESKWKQSRMVLDQPG